MNNSKLAKNVRKIPVIGYTLSIVYNIANLPRTIAEIERLKVDTDDKSKLFAENHLLDNFYTQFEDKFRGSEESIYKRIETAYSDIFTNDSKLLAEKPVLDIGSGRGEFLQLLADKGLTGTGIDINHDMVERAKSKGLDVIQADATKYLNTASNEGKFSAITGFHIVEHIPFVELLNLFAACHSGLAKDGFVLFETPNPENLIVGSCNFYTDPSHLKPLPPALLKFALESVGFVNVEVRKLHPMDINIETTSVDSSISERLFGPRDYCVIGYK